MQVQRAVKLTFEDEFKKLHASLIIVESGTGSCSLEAIEFTNTPAILFLLDAAISRYKIYKFELDPSKSPIDVNRLNAYLMTSLWCYDSDGVYRRRPEIERTPFISDEDRAMQQENLSWN